MWPTLTKCVGLEDRCLERETGLEPATLCSGNLGFAIRRPEREAELAWERRPRMNEGGVPVSRYVVPLRRGPAWATSKTRRPRSRVDDHTVDKNGVWRLGHAGGDQDSVRGDLWRCAIPVLQARE